MKVRLIVLIAFCAAFTVSLGSPEARAVITTPIPPDAPSGPPPIPSLPEAGETPPPAEAITDPIEPGAVCGGWYLQSNYGDRWPASSTWWEFRCTYVTAQYYPDICHGSACNADGCSPWECLWVYQVWVDYFYWDGEKGVFAGESYSYSILHDVEGLQELWAAWWDAPTAQWYRRYPTIGSFTPTSGPAGTLVTLTGSAFTGATSVAVGGQGHSASFVVDSDTQISVTVPVGATTGVISVITPHGTVTSADSFTVTVDITPPETTITSGPSGITDSAAATFEFSASEPSAFECSLDGSGFASCASPASYTGLGEGSHTFRVYAIDSADNTDTTPAERSWTVDTTPPETTITSGPSGITNSTSATFEFSASEPSSFECSLDDSGFASCASPASYTGLGEGPHTFRVYAIDAAEPWPGNIEQTPAERTWTVDTVLGSLSVDPAFGPPGAAATVSGAGFAPNETVNLSWWRCTQTCVAPSSLGSATANGSGAFSGKSITIPAATAGVYAIVGFGATGGTLGFTPFLVLGTLSVSPPSGPAGSAATASGSNFAANEQIALSFWTCTPSCSQVASLGTTTANGSGAFSQPITTPNNVTAGAYFVVAIASPSNGVGLGAFTVTGAAALADRQAAPGGVVASVTAERARRVRTLVADAALSGRVARRPTVARAIDRARGEAGADGRPSSTRAQS
jgi:hypothetical protein